MTIHQKLAAVPEGGLDITKAVHISFAVDGTTNQEKERQKKRHSSLNPKISTTITMGDNSSTSAATSAGTFTSTAGASASASASATGASINGTSNTGTMSRKAASTASGVWTAEEEKKLASAVEAFGSHTWARIAVNVPGRNANQCSSNWRSVSRKASATASGTWTVEEEKKLVYEVEAYGGRDWAETAKMFPGRNENQCYQKWHNMSRLAPTNTSGTWAVEEEKKLASAVEAFGSHTWARIAVNVPRRNENQCSSKWWSMSSKASATATAKIWSVEEEKKLVSAVETLGTSSWVKLAANVPGRSETQCWSKWRAMSRKSTATTRIDQM
jgi:hypothetical protein